MCWQYFSWMSKDSCPHKLRFCPRVCTLEPLATLMRNDTIFQTISSEQFPFNLHVMNPRLRIILLSRLLLLDYQDGLERKGLTVLRQIISTKSPTVRRAQKGSSCPNAVSGRAGNTQSAQPRRWCVPPRSASCWAASWVGQREGRGAERLVGGWLAWMLSRHHPLHVPETWCATGTPLSLWWRWAALPTAPQQTRWGRNRVSRIAGVSDSKFICHLVTVDGIRKNYLNILWEMCKLCLERSSWECWIKSWGGGGGGGQIERDKESQLI